MKILKKCEHGTWSLIWSVAVSQEIELTPDDERKQKMLGFERISEKKIKGNSIIKTRAFALEAMGFGSL